MVYACIDNRKQRSLSIWPLLMRVTNECETGLLKTKNSEVCGCPGLYSSGLNYARKSRW